MSEPPKPGTPATTEPEQVAAAPQSEELAAAILRDKLLAKAEATAQELESARRDHARLEKEVAHYQAVLKVVMTHEKTQGTEFPDLCREAARKPSNELLVVFESLSKQVESALRELNADFHGA
jgi:hypothetical protein